jgi:hypothetical protein
MLPTARLPTSCPLTELTGKVPDISNLVPIGYPSVVTIYNEERSKKRTTCTADSLEWSAR